MIEWDTQSTFEHVLSVADLALDLVAGPAVAQALAVGLVADRGPVVVLVRDLDREAVVEAAAAQDRDQGPEAVRDREQAREQDRVAAMALDRAADRGPAADTVAARAQDLAPAGSLAMASAFTSGTTLSKNGRSYTRLAP